MAGPSFPFTIARYDQTATNEQKGFFAEALVIQMIGPVLWTGNIRCKPRHNVEKEGDEYYGEIIRLGRKDSTVATELKIIETLPERYATQKSSRQVFRLSMGRGGEASSNILYAVTHDLGPLHACSQEYPDASRLSQ